MGDDGNNVRPALMCYENLVDPYALNRRAIAGIGVVPGAAQCYLQELDCKETYEGFIPAGAKQYR